MLYLDSRRQHDGDRPRRDERPFATLAMTVTRLPSLRPFVASTAVTHCERISADRSFHSQHSHEAHLANVRSLFDLRDEPATTATPPGSSAAPAPLFIIDAAQTLPAHKFQNHAIRDADRVIAAIPGVVQRSLTSAPSAQPSPPFAG